MTNRTISALLPNQVPEFVREQYPLFIQFMEAYYEFLEQANSAPVTDQVIDRTKNLLSYTDIDFSIDSFAQKLYQEFLLYFPQNTKANKQLILKNAKDFYRSKGSEKSFKFLFRALFGDEVNIYLPKNDILIASSGNFIQDQTLRVTNVLINGVDPPDLAIFVATKITGSKSRATAYVENFLTSFQNGFEVDELFLSHIQGNFVDDEEITATLPDGTSLAAEVISGYVTGLNIVFGGTNYKVGQALPFARPPSGNAATGFISKISSGNINAVYVQNGGAGFQVNNQVLFLSGGGLGANAIVGTIALSNANTTFIDFISTYANVNLSSSNYGFPDFPNANINTVLQQAFTAGGSLYHPPNYTFFYDLISLYQNVTLNSANYGFPAITNANQNTILANAFTLWSFGPSAPISSVILESGGQGYSSTPRPDPVGNTAMKNLGVLGRMNIVASGKNYANGETLTFITNQAGAIGAYAIIDNVDANGSILHVSFTPDPAGILPTGGIGYSLYNLPIITITSTYGAGANIVVTDIIAGGYPGAQLFANTDTLGTIQGVVLTTGGDGYTNSAPPIINMTNIGGGNAIVTANFTSGFNDRPGYYLDDTGFLSSYNFLQDKDYYQNFSYVIKARETLDQYASVVKKLIHPSGMKLWAEVMVTNNDTLIPVPVSIQETFVTRQTTGSLITTLDNEAEIMKGWAEIIGPFSTTLQNYF